MRSVGKSLTRWGFTPQKPIKKAYEQRPEAVRKWLDEEYPAIEQRAKAEGGEIHWGTKPPWSIPMSVAAATRRLDKPRWLTPSAERARNSSMIATVANPGEAR